MISKENNSDIFILNNHSFSLANNNRWQYSAINNCRDFSISYTPVNDHIHKVSIFFKNQFGVYIIFKNVIIMEGSAHDRIVGCLNNFAGDIIIRNTNTYGLLFEF